MTVASGAPGGYKNTVFWISCPSAPTTGGGGETGGGGSSGGGGSLGGGGTVAGTTGSRSNSSAGTAVLGEKLTRGSTATAAVGTAVTPGAGSLPFTGAEIGGLAAAGAAALGGGGFLMLAGRRRRRAGAHR
jgi:hypothetical protein